MSAGRRPDSSPRVSISSAMKRTAVFAEFIAPYHPETKDRKTIYSPPQMIHIFAPDGGLTRPYVMGYAEEMDPVTYEITFVSDPNDVRELAFFVKGDPWTFLGIEFVRHLIGTSDGSFVHLLGTDSLGRDVFSRMLIGTRITMLMGLMVMGASCFIGTFVGVSSGYQTSISLHSSTSPISAMNSSLGVRC